MVGPTCANEVSMGCQGRCGHKEAETWHVELSAAPQAQSCQRQSFAGDHHSLLGGAVVDVLRVVKTWLRFSAGIY